MKELINQLLKSDLTFNQMKTILFLISNYEMLLEKDLQITISELAEFLNLDVKALIKDLKELTTVSEKIQIKVEEKELYVQVNTATFVIVNNTRSKLQTKSVKLKKEAKELFAYWQECCGKSRAKYDKKRETTLHNAIDKYGFEQAKKAIEGCSKTLWNMGYDRYGNKNPTVYNDLSLIFRNIEYVEKFINNANLEELSIQIEKLQLPTKTNVLSQNREEVETSRNDWKEERMRIFDDE